MGNGMKASATYALWGNRQGEDCTLFLGNGTLLQTPSASVKADVSGECVARKKKRTDGITRHPALVR